MTSRLVRSAFWVGLLLLLGAGFTLSALPPSDERDPWGDPDPIWEPPDPPPTSPTPEPLDTAPPYDPNAWNDACSIPLAGSLPPILSVALRRGLDVFLFGACTRHDQCFGQCNGPEGPFLGFEHKSHCNLVFFLEWQEACAFWAPLIDAAYPGTWNEFLEACGAAGAATYAVESALEGPFLRGQCHRGCNPDRCQNLGESLPASCGGRPRPSSDATWLNNPTPGVCYNWVEPPPPPDPDPGPIGTDPCAWVYCPWDSCGCNSLEYFCCGSCLGWQPWDPWYPWNPWEPIDPFYPFRQVCGW